MNQTSVERMAKDTENGIRFQHFFSASNLIKASHWWVGVRNSNFPVQFSWVNQKMGVLQSKLFGNIQIEYLCVLATKGVVGLLLYVRVILQTCRMAWDKKDELKRIFLLMFVLLFLLSMNSKSMMIDMDQGCIIHADFTDLFDA